MKNITQLTEIQHQTLIGLLLGDGHLELPKKGKILACE